MWKKLGMKQDRKHYPSDVSDEEWAFCAPYLTLMKEDAPQEEYPLRELYNGLRWFVRAGLSVADDAQRSAAVARGATADAALDVRGML